MSGDATSTPSLPSDTKPRWGWQKLPLEIKRIVFDYAGMPSELRIHVHHFEPPQDGIKGVDIEYAVEIKNKEEWRDMLRFQAIKQINADIIQDAIAKKKIAIKLDIVGHHMQGDAWKDMGIMTPKMEHCVADWDKFLAKFPFQRMTTVVPYILRDLVPPAERKVSMIEEMHYLKLTYDRAQPEKKHGPADPLAWKQEAAVWKKGENAGMSEEAATTIHTAIEANIASFVKYLFRLGPDVESMVCLQERLTWVPDLVSSEKFQISRWFMAVMAARGVFRTASSSRVPMFAAIGARVTPLAEVVWEV
ncbi:hypothetical protein M409DRAFT_22212 [Zasmidium cellare ATCC 36951]|uniref:Uncharacterized protein n=1 Tax=Zasmidium cellare ATCC 36951 TaxID=1080233 RepID=A0A6A6CML5_ZASCE|nr:uncharacterized protein M409DRAFT_22212 [Zasmidium cellare ATCC 36951]KAF2167400.1 hypothetical protein M409DRAFT_22212 [Zasmidium cellare ATCC 36951]